MRAPGGKPQGQWRPPPREEQRGALEGGSPSRYVAEALGGCGDEPAGSAGCARENQGLGPENRENL